MENGGNLADFHQILSMYSKTTNSVKVSVIPEYDSRNSHPLESRFVFRYNVNIENMGDGAIKVLRRNWLVYDLGFGTSEVSGSGVIGMTPEIAPGDSFNYYSHVVLRSGIGSMSGEYVVKNLKTSEEMHIEIPVFRLFSKILQN